MYIRANIEPFLENKSWWSVYVDPKMYFEPYPKLA